MLAWYFVWTIVFASGNEMQIEIEKDTKIACQMAHRALENSVINGRKGLPPTRLQNGLSECKEREKN